MEDRKEKEFSIGNILNLLIMRSEVLEIKFTSLILNRNILIISFYDSEKNQISYVASIIKINILSLTSFKKNCVFLSLKI